MQFQSMSNQFFRGVTYSWGNRYWSGLGSLQHIFWDDLDGFVKSRKSCQGICFPTPWALVLCFSSIPLKGLEIRVVETQLPEELLWYEVFVEAQ